MNLPVSKGNERESPAVFGNNRQNLSNNLWVMPHWCQRTGTPCEDCCLPLIRPVHHPHQPPSSPSQLGFSCAAAILPWQKGNCKVWKQSSDDTLKFSAITWQLSSCTLTILTVNIWFCWTGGLEVLSTGASAQPPSTSFTLSSCLCSPLIASLGPPASAHPP